MLSSPRPRAATRAVLGLLTALLLLLLGAPPAAADGGRPTSYESVVDRVTPALTGVDVDVAGGDAFLVVSARPGTRVEIPGYDGEPYLRIRPDGTVERNRRSPSTFLNQSRAGGGSLPADADSSAEPRWEATGGLSKVAWHDHRIHWMVSVDPEPGPGGLVQEFSVPMTVDGRKVVAEGRLLYRGSTAPPVQLLAVVAVLVGSAAAAVVLARRRPAQLLALFGASVVALLLAWAAFRANPPDAGASLVPVLVAVAAMLLVAIAPGLPRLPVALAAAATLIGWSVVRVAVLWKPVLPSTLPGWVDRLGTAAVLGTAVGVAVVLVRHPLGEDTEETPGADATAGTA